MSSQVVLTFKCSSNVPKSMSFLPTPLSLVLRIRTSMDSSTSMTQVMIRYDEVDRGRSGIVKSRKVVKS